MGEPVRIIDLAETMIRLSGKEPGKDIAIEFVGPRPGEKLHEELWSRDRDGLTLVAQAIMLVTRPPIDPDWLEVELDELARLVDAGETLERGRAPDRARRRSASQRRAGRRRGRRRGDARARDRLAALYGR